MMIYFHAQNLQIAAVVIFYMVSALTMVFINKAVSNNYPELPLIFLLIQLTVAVMLLHLSSFISNGIDIPQKRLDFQVARKFFPVVSVNVIGQVLNTLCLRDVETSFFQIAKGLVLPLMIIIFSKHTRTSPSYPVLLAVGLVTVGFILGVTPLSSPLLPTTAIPSEISVIYGILSSLSTAIHAVLIKTSLPYCNNSIIELAWWTNAGSALILAPCALLSEEFAKLYALSSSPQTEDWNGGLFIWGSLITGFFGFLLCIAGLLSVVILCGASYYTWIKSTETSQDKVQVTLKINRGIDIEAAASKTSSNKTADDDYDDDGWVGSYENKEESTFIH